MDTAHTSRFLTIPISMARNIASALAQTDSRGILYRHRLGAWEAAASARAREVVEAAKRQD